MGTPGLVADGGSGGRTRHITTPSSTHLDAACSTHARPIPASALEPPPPAKRRAVATSTTMHADRESVPPKLVTTRRAHPEGHYEISAPLRAFLEKRCARGELNADQARKLKTLRRLDDRPSVTFGPAHVLCIDSPAQAGISPSYPSGGARLPPPRPATPIVRMSGNASSASATEDTSNVEGWSSLSDFSVFDLHSSSDESDCPSLKSRSSESDGDCDLQLSDLHSGPSSGSHQAPSLPVEPVQVSTPSVAAAARPPFSEARIICGRHGPRSLPAKTSAFDMRSPSMWGNPFREGSDSSSAREAYRYWWHHQSTVQEVCSHFALARSVSWRGHEVARSAARLLGIETFARAVKAGNRLAFGADCSDAQHCHTLELRRMVLDRAAEMVAESSEPSASPGTQDQPRRYLIVFSGDNTLTARLAAQIKAKDITAIVDEFDIVNDGVKQDVLSPEVQQGILRDVFARVYSAIFIAIPCSSYSIVSGRKLRSKLLPRGMNVPKRWRAYLRKHNRLTDFGLLLAEVCQSLDVPWAVENPADRGRPGPARWARFADWGSLWDQPKAQELMSAGGKRFLVPLCMLGSPFQKYLEVMVSPMLIAVAEQLFGGLACTHAKHADVAMGKNDRGQSKAASSATYPVGFNVLLARLLTTLFVQGAPAPRSSKTFSSSPGQLHVGSSRPHAIDGDAPEFQRVHRAAPAGSLRTLEPELDSVLLDEALPYTNEPRRTDPEDPPPRPSVVPGPFTTAQLIPEGVVPEVLAFGEKMRGLLDRASRGTHGWRHARDLRPDTLVYEEHEALHPCGHGFAWQRVDPSEPLTSDSLWAAVLPSSWPDDPPHPDAKFAIDTRAFRELAEAEGLTDLQLVSWVSHGFPGVGLPNAAVLNACHVGALKEVSALMERDGRDVEHGFCSEPSLFPTIWPMITDPCNIVVQNGKPRLTIDKTMWTSGRAHLPSYNMLIDLAEQARRSGRLTLPRVSEFARAIAILRSPLTVFARLAQPACPVQLLIRKSDLFAFFRMHKKQRLHVRESGRVLKKFNHDWCCNFGERDAPDHTCRSGDALDFFCRSELRRLDVQYPTAVPQLRAWLDHRRARRAQAGDASHRADVVWDVLYFMCIYVDDEGLAAFDDKLFDAVGSPIIHLLTDNKGVQSRVHRTRVDFYAEVCDKIAIKIGFIKPDDKKEGPGLDLVFLGIFLDLDVQRRLLPQQKATNYSALIRICLKGRRTMPNGRVVIDVALFNSLIHRLLHASDVIPLGKQHLFYCRRDLKAARDVVISKGRSLYSVIISAAAQTELEWWLYRLSNLDLTGLPLASRLEFPGASSDTHLIRYSDAARELPPSTRVSGAGAWWILRRTFYYIAFVFTPDELRKYSINVLEAHARDVGGMVALDKAKQLGFSITHTTAYVDNTTAEAVAENGRTSTEMLNSLNTRRLRNLQERGVHESNERVASIDNDVADLISRGRVQEALRFAREAGLACEECQVPSAYRALPSPSSQ